MTEQEVQNLTILLATGTGIMWGIISGALGAPVGLRLVIAIAIGLVCYILMRALQIFKEDDNV